jgi:hypothetical protein
MLGRYGEVTHFSFYIPTFTDNDGILPSGATVKIVASDGTSTLSLPEGIKSNSFISFTGTTMDTETVLNIGAAGDTFYIYYGADKNVNARFLKNRAKVPLKPKIGYIGGNEAHTLIEAPRLHSSEYLNMNYNNYDPLLPNGFKTFDQTDASAEVVRIGVYSLNINERTWFSGANNVPFCGFVANIDTNERVPQHSSTGKARIETMLSRSVRYEVVAMDNFTLVDGLFVTAYNDFKNTVTGAYDGTVMKVLFNRPTDVPLGTIIPLEIGVVDGGPPS